MGVGRVFDLLGIPREHEQNDKKTKRKDINETKLNFSQKP